MLTRIMMWRRCATSTWTWTALRASLTVRELPSNDGPACSDCRTASNVLPRDVRWPRTAAVPSAAVTWHGDLGTKCVCEFIPQLEELWLGPTGHLECAESGALTLLPHLRTLRLSGCKQLQLANSTFLGVSAQPRAFGQLQPRDAADGCVSTACRRAGLQHVLGCCASWQRAHSTACGS